jgi:hypothetical protein
MARLRLPILLAALVATLTLVPVASSTTSSLTPNFDATTVRYGDAVSFTAVYPKEATRSVTTVQHENPDVDLRCYQSGTQVFWQILSFPNERRNQDGTITGVTNPVTLAGASRGGTWTGGAASCYATVYYFSKDKATGVLTEHTLATFNFGVAA